jgi:hypothetical protein
MPSKNYGVCAGLATTPAKASCLRPLHQTEEDPRQPERRSDDSRANPRRYSSAATHADRKHESADNNCVRGLSSYTQKIDCERYQKCLFRWRRAAAPTPLDLCGVCRSHRRRGLCNQSQRGTCKTSQRVPNLLTAPAIADVEASSPWSRALRQSTCTRSWQFGLPLQLPSTGSLVSEARGHRMIITRLGDHLSRFSRTHRTKAPQKS